MAIEPKQHTPRVHSTHSTYSPNRCMWICEMKSWARWALFAVAVEKAIYSVGCILLNCQTSLVVSMLGEQSGTELRWGRVAIVYFDICEWLQRTTWYAARTTPNCLNKNWMDDMAEGMHLIATVCMQYACSFGFHCAALGVFKWEQFYATCVGSATMNKVMQTISILRFSFKGSFGEVFCG